MVKALVEERLKVLGKIPEINDNFSNAGKENFLSLASPQKNMQQKSVNSPALGETPGKVRGPKKNLAKELDKDTWMKRTLGEKFGSVAKATDLDFVYVSPSKATKDDKDAMVPAYGRGCRGRRTVKDEDAADKKKAVYAEAALKRKEKADGKRKEVELKKQKQTELENQEAEAKIKETELKKKKQAELKKQKEAELKNKNMTPPRVNVIRCMVEKSGEDSDFAVVNDEVLAEENELAPESDVENQEVVRSTVVR